jgi:hypothetical protein
MNYQGTFFLIKYEAILLHTTGVKLSATSLALTSIDNTADRAESVEVTGALPKQFGHYHAPGHLDPNQLSCRTYMQAST